VNFKEYKLTIKPQYYGLLLEEQTLNLSKEIIRAKNKFLMEEMDNLEFQLIHFR